MEENKNYARDPLEEYFRRTLSHYEAAPSQDLWERIEADLEVPESAPKEPWWLPYRLHIAAAAALLLLVVALLDPTGQTNRVRPTAHPDAPRDVKIIPHLPTGEVKSILEPRAMGQGTSPTPLVSSPSVPPQNEPVIDPSTAQNSSAHPLSTTHQSGIPTIADSAKTLPTTEIAALLPLTLSVLPPLPALPTLPPSLSTDIGQRSHALVSASPIRPLRPLRGWSAGAYAFFAHALPTKPPSPPRPGGGKPPRPVFITQPQEDRLSWEWGLRLGKRLSEHWGLELGASYLESTRTTAHVARLHFGDGNKPPTGGSHSHSHREFFYQLNTHTGSAEVALRVEAANPSDPPQNTEPVVVRMETTERIRQVRFPILASYGIGKGRWRATIRAGICLDVFLRNDLQLRRFTSENHRLRLPPGERPSLTWSPARPTALSYWLSTGATYRWRRHLALSVEPVLIGPLAYRDVKGQPLSGTTLIGGQIGWIYSW